MLFSCIHGSTKVITRVKGMVPYLHNIAVEECHSCKTVGLGQLKISYTASYYKDLYCCFPLRWARDRVVLIMQITDLLIIHFMSFSVSLPA